MVEFTLDTDIGSDVDDLMALAMVLGSAEMNLRAVTTVYGDTLLGARDCAASVRNRWAPSSTGRGRSARDPLGPAGLVGRPRRSPDAGPGVRAGR
jgi:inosine-uridine nucleoside N-ribohydrolase